MKHLNSLEFTLTQHTPLIHFQHNQHGASLRASEVKPKLDKYLVKYIFKDQFEEFQHFLTGYNRHDEKKFIEKCVKNNFRALDYKINIVVRNVVFESIVPGQGFPCFFGNLGDVTDKYKFSFTKEPITVIITSRHHELLDILQRQICSFFAWYNFGTRQSKGFGSFYINKEDALWDEPDMFPSHFSISQVNKVAPISEWSKLIFSKVDLLHRAIRTGINESHSGGIYMKPLIWQYFKNQGINWEKRAIKKQFFNNRLLAQIDEYTDDDYFEEDDTPLSYASTEYRLIKDLLGLSTNESWKFYEMTIEKDHDEIKRFQSPLFYKPIGDRNEYKVYVAPTMVNEFFLGKEFTISCKDRDLSISTPKEFDIYDFYDFITDYDLNIEDYIWSGRNVQTKSRLVRIFDDLIKNKL